MSDSNRLFFAVAFSVAMLIPTEGGGQGFGGGGGCPGCNIGGGGGYFSDDDFKPGPGKFEIYNSTEESVRLKMREPFEHDWLEVEIEKGDRFHAYTESDSSKVFYVRIVMDGVVIFKSTEDAALKWYYKVARSVDGNLRLVSCENQC